MLKELCDVNLKSYNSFGVEANASSLIEFDTDDDLRTLCQDRHEVFDNNWNVLGGGNNTLFTDNCKTTLIHPTSKRIEIIGTSDNRVTVRVDAGVEWDDLVGWSVDNDLWGIENLSLIPGQVGASPVQNIGAYGIEAKDTIEQVHMFVPQTCNTLTLSNEFCAFGYRDSVFKRELKGKVIITSVTFTLSKTPSPKLDYGALREKVEEKGGISLQNIREAIIEIRESKLPDPKITGNAGSFFKNPIVNKELAEKIKNRYADMPTYAAGDNMIKIPAGWLIEKAGWKGYSKGRVGVHSRQALVLINNGGATGSEIISFAHEIQQDIKENFGVEISPEVNILP